MSDLYTEAKHRVLSNIDLNHVNEKFRKYFLDVMNHLSIQHKKDEMKTYRLYRYDGNEHYGIQLDKIRFRASNKYELWMKIYHYFINHGATDEFGNSYYQKLYYQYMLDEAYIQYYENDPSDHAAMLKTIEFELDLWEKGDTLWWDEEDIEYV